MILLVRVSTCVDEELLLLAVANLRVQRRLAHLPSHTTTNRSYNESNTVRFQLRKTQPSSRIGLQVLAILTSTILGTCHIFTLEATHINGDRFRQPFLRTWCVSCIGRYTFRMMNKLRRAAGTHDCCGWVIIIWPVWLSPKIRIERFPYFIRTTSLAYLHVPRPVRRSRKLKFNSGFQFFNTGRMINMWGKGIR